MSVVGTPTWDDDNATEFPVDTETLLHSPDEEVIPQLRDTVFLAAPDGFGESDVEVIPQLRDTVHFAEPDGVGESDVEVVPQWRDAVIEAAPAPDYDEIPVLTPVLADLTKLRSHYVASPTLEIDSDEVPAHTQPPWTQPDEVDEDQDMHETTVQQDIAYCTGFGMSGV